MTCWAGKGRVVTWWVREKTAREYRQCRTFLQATHPPILGPQATPHLSKCCAGNGHFPNGIRIHQLQLFSCGSWRRYNMATLSPRMRPLAKPWADLVRFHLREDCDNLLGDKMICSFDSVFPSPLWHFIKCQNWNISFQYQQTSDPSDLKLPCQTHCASI